MRLYVGEKMYVARFSHKSSANGRRLTECQLELDKTMAGGVKTLLGEGKASCSRRDQFCKKEGRILALGRAMRDCPLTAHNRTLRRQLWTAYFKLTTPPVRVR